jgi:abequosyltransferase
MNPGNQLPSLSICIATRNRSQFIGETLDRILEQCRPDIEIVVVDGASTDNTGAVVSRRAIVHPKLRYLPQQQNSGIDGDFDKAVQYAVGKYCWLMSDDDLILPGAVAKILKICESNPDAIILNAEVRTADMTEILISSRLGFEDERRYAAIEMNRLLKECGAHLSFIGALVVRRELWLGRKRSPYYGSEFIHVGVLFQDPLPLGAVALGEPLIRIRYGVGNWTSRSFHVWMFKWPALIWSFGWLSEASRAAVTPQQPWRSLALLLLFRAKGWYSWDTFIEYLWPQARPRSRAFVPAIVALIPGRLLNVSALAVSRLKPGVNRGGVYDLKRSPYFFGRR